MSTLICGKNQYRVNPEAQGAAVGVQHLIDSLQDMLAADSRSVEAELLQDVDRVVRQVGILDNLAGRCRRKLQGIRRN